VEITSKVTLRKKLLDEIPLCRLASIGEFGSTIQIHLVNIQSDNEVRAIFHTHGGNEHGSGLKPILAGSGLDQTAIFLKIGGSGLDRTEKIWCFVVIILTTSSMLVIM